MEMVYYTIIYCCFRYFFINLNLKKCLLAKIVATGIVYKTLKAIFIYENKSLFYTTCSKHYDRLKYDILYSNKLLQIILTLSYNFFITYVVRFTTFKAIYNCTNYTITFYSSKMSIFRD